MPAPVEYRVGMEPNAHLFSVEARFTDLLNDRSINLQLPVWTPGSYLVREYQRHLQDLSFTDGEGRALPFAKTDKATFRVERGDSPTVIARYRVYAHEVTVRTAHLDATHGFWNGACLFLYCEPLRGREARVTVEAPAGWHVTTALAGD